MTDRIFKFLAETDYSTIISTYYLFNIIFAIVIKLVFFRKSNTPDSRLPEITCSNPFCRYSGNGLKTQGSNYWLFLLLLFTLGFIVAIFYLAVCGRPGIVCPRCGERIPRKKCRYELISA